MKISLLIKQPKYIKFPDGMIMYYLGRGGESVVYKIENYAIKHGMRTLRKDALQKFLNGDTSLEEVLRVIQEN